MNAMHFLVSFIFDFYVMLVLLRLWLQLAQADFYNPFSQFIVKATHAPLRVIRGIVPPIGRIDTASLIFAFIVILVKLLVLAAIKNASINGNWDFLQQLDVLGLLVYCLYQLLDEMFSLAIFVLIARAILSFISQGNSPVEHVLAQLTEPMLSPIRKRLPDTGGLDFSVLIAIVGLTFLSKLVGDLLI